MVNDRQFVIAKREYCGYGFRHVMLNDGFILSYHQNLQIYINQQYNLLLLGDSLECNRRYAGTD